ncbi:hypothetical protein [Leucobacter komagatae]|uniref:Uncharacterized protein n=1 Tax=Leucobacter komagatae TaxID=55969 RepID=A0A0D0INH9_9MICO|nr:hypothetical protein [Leucobacter komagatae]KIP53124.1 hypothetical protein SD72_04605 [Leucobacter komagatae]
MSQIEIDAEMISELLKKNGEFATESADGLGGFSSSFDGGLASGEISIITRLAIEAAQLAADASQALGVVAGAALDGQLVDESEVAEALDNFTRSEFGE